MPHLIDDIDSSSVERYAVSGRGEAMRQRTSLLEWQFVENKGDLQDAPWPPLVDRLLSTPSTRSHLHRRYVWGGSIALSRFLATTSTWLWRRAEAGLNQVEWELKDAVQLELVSDMPDRTRPVVNWPTGAAVSIWQSQLGRQGYATSCRIRCICG